MVSEPSDQLDLVFGALADATRRDILARLARSEANVNDLVALFGLAQPTISKHLKMLERAGLVVRGRLAQYRPVMLNAVELQPAAMWLESYRHLWDQTAGPLDSYAKALRSEDQSRKRKRTRR